MSMRSAGAAIPPIHGVAGHHRRQRGARTGLRRRPRGGTAVRQTVSSVVVEVQPKSAGYLRDLILQLRDTEERTTPSTTG